MKRLKMPRIPTRIPLPDLPSIHRRSSRESSDTTKNDVIPAPVTETAQDTKPVEQTKEVNDVGHRKVNIPKIPLPSISKPSARKLSVPKIPLPGISMPSRSKKSSPQEEKVQPEINENITPIAASASSADATAQPEEKATPKVSIFKRNIFKKPSSHQTKEKEAVKEPATPPSTEHELSTDAFSISGQQVKTVTTAESAAAPQLGETKPAPEAPKAKGKSKISMPKLSKVSMPSMSLGKGGAKSTSKRVKGSSKSTGKRILAVTIEGTDIRLLSYHNQSVESWKSVSFDAHLLKMGQVADPEGLGEVIKKAITGIETNRCYVICALPGLRSVSRIITIPNVGKKELDAVVPREVRRTMTVSEEDNYFHWQILPSETETTQTHVFLLAVPKEPMSLLLRAFSHAGLNPSNIDLKPLALMRAINQKDAIIANCEGNSMELVIVSNDIPVLIRSVFLGEGVINQDFAVGRISDELGRTIVTYNEINKEHPLDQNIPVYLTGSAAAGVPFALNVAALTGRTVQPLESPIPLPADLPIAEYMVNIGLLLKVV
ncbi:MAG: pilus assembly protein PilM [Dehalococcoidia bacterium]|jgi:hypothetical protein